jgi:hypothetical protein
MAYGVNAPFGLRPYSHLNGGADDIRTNSNYVIDVVTASTLNKGDPVIFAPAIADSAVNAYYKGGQSVITRYNPNVALQVGGTPTTITNSPPIVGVFMGCEYWVNGTYYNQEYWVAGTPATSVVKAYVIDDPNVIWDIQLGTWLGSNGNNVGAGVGTAFVVPPTMQRQVAPWPNTYNGANLNPIAANSALIGSNVMLLTERGPTAGAGSSGSLTTITKWNGTAAVPAGYADNPIIGGAGYTLGVSTFYACPSLAATTANPSVANGENEYVRDESIPFKVLGFTPDPRNVPATYGFPSNAANAGTYFNTPFLNVYGIINNHAFRPGIASVTPA